MSEHDQPHSAQFLTDVRDLWWNLDQLRLIAERTGLGGVRFAADVGCGLGHWSRTIARVLPAGASLVGVDREAEWVDRAAVGPAVEGVSLSFVQGEAERLPFEDASLDLVTCQTLLIHLRDPSAVLAEMARVLKPGGVLLAAEPNNLGSLASFAAPSVDLDDLVAAFRLQAHCERGKHALGLGDNSLGERLAGLLEKSSWQDVRAWVCDKTRLVTPPYSEEAKRFIADERRQYEGGAVGWPREETARYFHAGGGDPAAFEDLWTRGRRLLAQRFADIDAGRFASLDGSLLYLIAARRVVVADSAPEA